MARGGVAALTFLTMSYIVYDMNVIARDFIKRFSHFKRQAMTGSPVKLVDRKALHDSVRKKEEE